VESDVRGALRGVYRQPLLPIHVRLRRFAQADPALLGVIGLEAGQQADVALLLMA
jgi:hypothetical protein